jgi:hypothetical protein
MRHPQSRSAARWKFRVRRKVEPPAVTWEGAPPGDSRHAKVGAGGNLKSIAKFFLRARPWQIVLLFFVVPVLAGIAGMERISTQIRSWHDFGLAEFFFLGVMAFSMFFFPAWFWSMGSFLDSIVKPELKLKARFFRFVLIYPFVYLFIFFPFLFLRPAPVPAAVIVPLSLFGMFCLLYIFYFVSKNLVLAETGEPASFSEYAGLFLLFCFFPIGVWVIQPRINRLYEERTSS